MVSEICRLIFGCAICITFFAAPVLGKEMTVAMVNFEPYAIQKDKKMKAESRQTELTMLCMNAAGASLGFVRNVHCLPMRIVKVLRERMNSDE